MVSQPNFFNVFPFYVLFGTVLQGGGISWDLQKFCFSPPDLYIYIFNQISLFQQKTNEYFLKSLSMGRDICLHINEIDNSRYERHAFPKMNICISSRLLICKRKTINVLSKACQWAAVSA